MNQKKRRGAVETIEHEPSKDDSEVEITDLHPQSEEQQAEAETPISPQTASDSLKRIDRRKERIWLNWRFVVIAGLLLLLLVAMLPIFPALRDRWNQLTSSRSAPAVAHVTPTATPIGSPWWSGHNVSLTIVDGVAYVGAADGVVSALRISDGALLWHFMTKGSAEGQPPVVNGVVYVSTALDRGVESVYALRASDGVLLWRYTSGGHLVFEPTVVGEVAYVGSQDGTVAALRTTDGSLLWHYKMNGLLIGMPTLFNGVIYAVSDKQTLFALDASDGALLYKMGGSFLRSPIVVNDVAYVSLDDGTEYAFQPSTGALLWRYTHDAAALVPPLVSNGIVYIIATKFAAYAALAPAAGDARQTSGSRLLLQRSVPVISASSSVYALRASDGTLLWHYTGNATQGYSWAAVADGVVYVSTLVNMYKGYVIALQGNNGSLVWSEATDDPPITASAILNGVVYVGAENGDLYALQAGNGSPLWHYTIFGAILSTPVLSGEMVYVGSANGIAYALRARDGVLLWYYLTKVGGS